MALKLVVLFLALAAIGALAARPRNVLNLECTDRTLVCWSHSHSDEEAPGTGFGKTCAKLICDETTGEMRLLVKSPSQTDRVDFSARRYPRETEPTGRYPALEAPECTTRFDLTNYLDHASFEEMSDVRPISTGGIEVPIPEKDPNEDYQNLVHSLFPPVNNQVHDLNADYAALWDDWQEKNKGRSGHVRQATQAGGEFKAEREQCRPDADQLQPENMIRPNSDNRCFSRKRMIVQVTEYLPVPNSVVDLVTAHTLILECGSCIEQPPIRRFPIPVKPEATAQCQASSYRLDVAHSFDKYDVKVSEAIHPNSDQSVGWQVAQLKYAQDEIVVNNAFTTVGGEIDAVWNGPHSWQAPGPHSYLFSTDVVVNQGSTPPSLGLSAQVNYCHNSGAAPIHPDLLLTCPELLATPPC